MAVQIAHAAPSLRNAGRSSRNWVIFMLQAGLMQVRLRAAIGDPTSGSGYR